MTGNKTSKICLATLLLIVLTGSFAVGEVRTVLVDDEWLIVMSEEDIKELLLIAEESDAMKRENKVLEETLKKHVAIYGQLVTQIGEVKRAYEAASATRNIFVGIAIVTSIAALAGVFLW